jgi:hypothetical protein
VALSDAMFVQPVATGSFSGSTSGTATLGSATTAGNTVIVVLGVGGGTIGASAVTGFTRDSAVTAGSAQVAAYGKNTTGGETSFAVTLSLAGPCAWAAFEVAGLDQSVRVDVAAASMAASMTSPTTPLTSTYDGWVLALHASYLSTGGVAPTITGHTGNVVEIVNQTATDGTKAVCLSMSEKFVQSLGTQQVTATASGTPTANASTVLVYTAAGARRAADVRFCAGFYGPSASALAAGPAGFTYADAVSGSPTIGTGDAVLGGNYVEISAAAAIEQVQFASAGATSGFGSMQVGRVSIRFPSSLPAGDVQISGGAATGYQFWYRSASGKIGALTASGTEQLSDTAVSADQRISIDWRVDSSTTTYALDWQVTYSDGGTPVAQTQATGTGTAGVTQSANLGWLASSTATIRYAGLVLSNTRGHFPLGDMRIYPLYVDPAGTLTISGTTGNFQTFAGATPTMSAWNATTARDAIDDVPPGLGASADGIAQVTAAATDYVAIPMQTLDLASIPGAIRGVRMCFAGWAASATAATISFRAYDGTTEYTLLATTTVNGFDNAAEKWVCRMVRGTSPTDWKQAKLDALTARVGFSDDATPDIGIHNIMAEVAVRTGQAQTLSGDLASVVADPDSQGIVSITTAAPAVGVDTTLYYETNTTPTTVTVPAGTTSTQPVNAPDAPTTNYIAVYWPPEGVPDA